jgi:hypothetical protein
MDKSSAIRSPEPARLSTQAPKHGISAQVAGQAAVPRAIVAEQAKKVSRPALPSSSTQDEPERPNKRQRTNRQGKKSGGDGSYAGNLAVEAKKAKQDELKKIELQQQILRLTSELAQITENSPQAQGVDNDNDDDDYNYTFSPLGGNVEGQSDERPPIDTITDENLDAIAHLNQERLAEQEQRRKNAPPANESRHDKAVREQRVEFDTLKAKLLSSRDPFASPLRECMIFFEDKAMAMEQQDGQRAKIMEIRSPASASSTEGVNYTVQDIMSIAPDDSDIAAWASDTILDVRINVINARIRQHKAYIAPITELSMFIFRDDNNGYYATDGEELNQRVGESGLEVRTRNLMEARNAAIDRANDPNVRADQLDASLYPAQFMPVDTTRLLFVYNISNSHWVLVEIEVDAAKTVGHVRLYNTLGGGSIARRRGDAYATVQRELPNILQLIKRRPDLGWQQVQFNREIPEVQPCPQQDNSTDCGFWSIHLAEQLATSQPLSGGIVKGVRKATKGKVLRWEVMKDIYHDLLNKQLEGKGPLEPTVRTGGGNCSTTFSKGRKGRKGRKVSKSPKDSSGNDLHRSGSNPDGPNDGHTENLGIDDLDLEAAEDEDSWKQFDDYRFDIREIICDILEDDDSYHPEEVILDELLSRVQALATEHNANVDDQESVICDRAYAILESPCSSFMRLDVLSPEEVNVEGTVTEGGPWYRLNPNPVHSVSTAARRALLSTPEQAPRLLDPIKMRFLLTISVARNSGAQRYEEDFDKMRERSKDQVMSFHNAFGQQTPLPRAVQTWNDMLDLEPGGSPWTDYVFSGTSRDTLFNRNSAGQDKKTGERLRRLLADANSWAQSEAHHRQPVALLWSDVDGGSSNGETWTELQEEYPNLDFYLVIVQSAFRCWNLAYFRADETVDNCWAAFEVDTLADLQRGVPDRLDDLDLADLPECRLTVASNLVQNLKQDMVLRGTQRDALHIHAQRQNQIAAQLTSKGRKTFELAQKDKECEVCEVNADEIDEERAPGLAWSRGHSADLAVVCDDHANVTGPERVAAPATGSHISSELLSPFAPAAAAKVKVPLPCKYCNTVFEDELSLDAHLETHDEARDDRPFPCTQCNKRFRFNGLLERHLKVHSNDKPHACTKCKSTFKGVEALKLHMRTVHPVRKGEWHGLHQCPDCDAKFEWLHELVKHSNKHNIVCSICEKRFDGPHGPKNLRFHMQTTHSEDRPWPCTMCEKRFKRKGGLRTHLEAVHDSQLEVMEDEEHRTKPHACAHPGCGRRFKLKNLLTAHLRVHSDERPHPCTHCEKRFKTKGELKSHLKAVHKITDASISATPPTPFACTHAGCGRSFRWKSRLKTHMISHSVERPFACTLCKKTFKSKSQLAHHMREVHKQ